MPSPQAKLYFVKPPFPLSTHLKKLLQLLLSGKKPSLVHIFEDDDVPAGVVGVEGTAVSDVVWKDCPALPPVEAVESWLMLDPSVCGLRGVEACCPSPVCCSVGCPCSAGWLLLFPDPEVL